ncbi:MAG: leucine-rich repeat protein [Oscillospiraceae bacterium]|nr:leucine-rich repeat protein [Oscillospiraceae bacterium]
MKKRILCTVMIVALVMSALATYIPSAGAASFGPYTVGNITWKVDVASDGLTGTLTISRRSGVTTNVPIPNYSSGSRPPWYPHSAQVTNIIIEDGISEIGNWAFADFSKATYAVVRGTVTRIGSDAFRGCTELTGFYANNATWATKAFTGMTAIGDNAFFNCGKLETLSIRDVASIGTGAFVGCASLWWIDAGTTGRVQSFGGAEGIIVEYNNTTATAVPVRVIKSSVALAGGSYSIPGTITTIDAEAFAYLQSINEIIVPASVTTIRDRAFAYNPGLTAATFLGDAPTSFGSNVFSGTNDIFKIVFFPQALRWTTPRWQGYPTEVNNSRLSLDKYVVVIEKGASADLTAAVYPTTATQSVTWTSSDDTIAKIAGRNNANDVRGVITGVDPGTATITVKAQGSGAIAECIVIVLDKGVSATSVILDKALITVGVDAAIDDLPTLTAIVRPYSDDPDTQKQIARDLIWTSSDPTVAYVADIDPATPTSLVRTIVPRKAGQTTITVSTPNGDSRATCQVTVTAAPAFVPATSVTLATTTVAMGAVVNLGATVQPATATNKNIDWSVVSSTIYAGSGSISSEGILTVPWGLTGNIVVEAAVKRGKADVDWGFSSNLDYTQQFTINVVSFIPVTDITGVPSQGYAGRPLQLTGTVSPPGAAYRTIEWSMGSTNTSAAYLDTTTGILVPQTPGIVSVVATVKNGVMTGSGAALAPYTQAFTIYVNPYVANTLTVRADPGGSVSGAGVSQYAAGETVKLTATPSQGYTFAGWYSTNGGTFDDTGNSTTQFTMPDNPTIVTAYFAYLGLPAGTVSGGGGGAVIPTPAHYFTYGTIYTRNSGAHFAHVTIRDFQLFSHAVLDGRTLVRNQHYTTGPSGGYTEITLVNGYLDTLAQGQHVLEIHFTDRISVSAVFTVLATPQISQSYDDVYVSAWYYADVVFVSDRAWMTSKPSEPRMFRPSNPVTQGEVIDALYRMAGSPTVLSQYGYYLQGRDAAYAWVLANAILPIGGVYNLNSAITRQDIVVILAKLVSVMGMRYTYVRGAITFADESLIDVSAKTAVTNLYRAGVISGRAEGTFVPLGNMTRAEYAAVLHRFATVIGNW